MKDQWIRPSQVVFPIHLLIRTLSLNVFVTYQAGNKIRLYPAFRSGYSDLDAMPKEFFDRWEMPGDEKVTNIPAISDTYYSYHHWREWFLSL